MNKPDWLPNTHNLRFGLEHDKGWNHIVKPLVDYCIEHNLEILQIKEKFGGLRFYSQTDPILQQMVAAAEALCDRTCEFCGVPMEPKKRTRKGGFWIKTLCDACYEKW